MGAERQQVGENRQLELFEEAVLRYPSATGEGGTGSGAHEEQ